MYGKEGSDVMRPMRSMAFMGDVIPIFGRSMDSVDFESRSSCKRICKVVHEHVKSYSDIIY